MMVGIRGLVEVLRQEIAKIQKLHLAYLQTARPDVLAINDHARREPRLREILDELNSITDWKKP